MRKDEALLPRTNLPAYVTDEVMDTLNKLCLEFTEGNRAEFVRQCLQIGIAEFEKKKQNKLILEMTQDANEMGEV